MYKRILVPVDGSDTSNLALDAAIELARAFGGKLRLLHVLDDTLWITGYDVYGGTGANLYDVMRDWADELLKKSLEKARAAGIDAEAMLHDKPGQRLGDAVASAAKLWNADLIVIGTHGRRGFDRLLLGSGAEQVIRTAPVPVHVVRMTTGDTAKEAS